MSETKGAGEHVNKVVSKKRLKREWAKLTQKNVPLKQWARRVLETKEPAHVVEYAEAWLMNKSM